jgi:hypothetical protein
MPSFEQWDILVRTAALVAAAIGCALPGGWRRRAAALARRPWASVAVVALASLTINAAVAVRLGMPRPRVHDEFSYLLAADTFAHARLANPTPACPDSFQSPHVLLRPTYASKYPPAQGLALAAGQLLGRPAFGVWLACAAAAVAVWWMALPFVGVEWALLAGLVAAVHPTVVDWGHVFWGGAVAMTGGAIVVGAWGRLWAADAPGVHPLTATQVTAQGSKATAKSRSREDRGEEDGKSSVPPVAICAAPVDRPRFFVLPSFFASVFAASRLRGRPSSARQVPTGLVAMAMGVRPGLWLGAGLVILANSRPYEGAVLSLPLMASLIWRRRWAAWPAGVVLLVGGAAMGAYDARVTGRPLRMPFTEYARQFDVYPKFWFLPKRSPPPMYPNATMAMVHLEKERGRYDLLRTPAGLASTALTWAWRLVQVHVRPAVLWIPLAASALVIARDRRARWLAVTVGIFLLGLLAENWFLPHYAAPLMPAGLLLIVLGWRRLAESTVPVAARLARGVAVGFVVAAALSAVAPPDPDLARFTRDDLLAEVPALTVGRQLVLVRYAADHPVEDEWVYNGCDIAGQPIVWAHSTSAAADADVARAYAPRRTWVLTVGKSTHAIRAWTQPAEPVR